MEKNKENTRQRVKETKVTFDNKKQLLLLLQLYQL
jgi:hypothetical protein